MNESTERFFQHTPEWQRRIFSGHVLCVESLQDLSHRTSHLLEQIVQEYTKEPSKKDWKKINILYKEIAKNSKNIEGLSIQMRDLLLEPKRQTYIVESKHGKNPEA